MPSPRHFITLREFSPAELVGLLRDAARLKRTRARGPRTDLAGRTLAMVFDKMSARTRVSFEVAMTELGGHSIYLDRAQIRLGERESVADVGRVLSRYVHGIAVRTGPQAVAEALAAHSTVPVINALTDDLHPCQALADVFTLQERFGRLRGLRLAFVGDGNNVARSLAILARPLGFSLVLASPPAYRFPAAFLATLGRGAGAISWVEDPARAGRDADAVYTDTWTSMGQEDEAAKRRLAFRAYQVNPRLMALSPKRAIFMHCLPAHRGEEVTDDVIDSARSAVWDQAENRLHAQKAVLLKLLS